jgi:ABC-2 type transport system permease protein
MSRIRVYVLEAKYELLRLARNRGFVIMTLGLPLVFYVVFGSIFGRVAAPGGLPVPLHMLGTFGAFGVIGLSMFSFGIVIAGERRSWLVMKRSTPMPPEAYLLAKLVMAFVFNAAYVTLLFAIAALVTGAVLTPVEYARLGAVLLAGTVPFAALGFALAYLTRDGRTAQGVANMLHLPMAFAAGLWMPLAMLPGVFGAVAPALPHHHFGQLALAQIAGAETAGSPAIHAAVLVGYTLVFFGLAVAGYKKDQAVWAH